MSYWTIVSADAAKVEGSWASELLQRWPKAAHPDVDNYIVVDTPKGYDGPVINVSILAREQELNNDQFAFLVAGYMAAEDRTIPILIGMWDADRLSRHPAWRLWCGHYEESNENQREEDWEALKVILQRNPALAAQWPPYSPDITNEQVQHIILSAIQALPNT